MTKCIQWVICDHDEREETQIGDLFVLNMSHCVYIMLNFIQRNFHQCSKSIKENPYHAFIQPHLEYASSAWNPGTERNKKTLQKVQRRAARFVQGNFRRRSSVSEMLKDLGWNSIESRRQTQRLTTLHKIFNDIIDIDQDQYIKPKPEREARRGNHMQFTEFQCSSTPFVESFFPESIRLWNTLPQKVIDQHRQRHSTFPHNPLRPNI